VFLLRLRGQDSSVTQKYLWRLVALMSGAASAAVVRQAAVALWRTSQHEDPPSHPGARDVGWRDALIWAVSVGVGAAVARVVAERGAAAAWTAATGSAPPIDT
jgi:Protein of unknown function (DUF4235)